MLALANKHKLSKPQDLKGLNIGVIHSHKRYHRHVLRTRHR
jgi:hypothetical protein